MMTTKANAGGREQLVLFCCLSEKPMQVAWRCVSSCSLLSLPPSFYEKNYEGRLKSNCSPSSNELSHRQTWRVTDRLGEGRKSRETFLYERHKSTVAEVFGRGEFSFA